jgi:pyrroloquinoline quinone biosynthesis protein E
MRRKLHSVIYEITERCNQRCTYCYNYWLGMNRKLKGDVPPERWLEITDRFLESASLKRITLSGGEPLLYEGLDDLCARLDGMGLKIGMITNGVLLTEDRVVRLLDRGVELFEITLLSYDGKTHDALTGHRSFESVVRAMRRVKKHGGELCTTIIGTSENISHVEKTAELAITLDSDAIMFNRVNLGGRSTGRYDLYPRRGDLLKALEALNDLSRTYGVFVHCGVPIPYCVADPKKFRRISFGRCPADIHLSYLTVESDGTLRTCNHTPLKIINLMEDGFDSLFSTAVWKDFTGKFPEMCLRCRYLKKCRASCRAAGYLHFGEWGKPDPFVLEMRRSR